MVLCAAFPLRSEARGGRAAPQHRGNSGGQCSGCNISPGYDLAAGVGLSRGHRPLLGFLTAA